MESDHQDAELDDVGQPDTPAPAGATVFPSTPAILFPASPATLSPEIGQPTPRSLASVVPWPGMQKWQSGQLQPTPLADIQVESDSDPDDLAPIANLAHRARLQAMLSAATVKVPTHRVRTKTARHLLSKYKLVYAKDLAKKVQPKPIANRYRVMWYKNHRCIAIRQKFGMKCQVGSCKVPEGVEVGHARFVAQKVKLDFLEQDGSWEDYSSDLLQQCLRSSL